MKADNLTISKVFSGGGDIHYVLPHFQREYTWDKPEWETLLQDVLGVYEESAGSLLGIDATTIEHFLGSIVVIHDGLRSGTVNAMKLVDGQQRLTSVSLMLCALGRVIAADHSDLARKIERMLVNTDEAGDLHFKILPTIKYGDRSTYCAIVARTPVPASSSRISAAFDYFERQLRQQITNGMDAQRLLQVTLNSLQVVFINLDQRENPYRIFESLNAKGKPLTQADLVRNYIAMRLPSQRQEQLFTTSWALVEELLRENRLVGRLPELTAFLRHYLAMRTGVLCEEKHVYARFRDRAEREFADSAVFEAELREIARFARYYDQLLRPSNCPDPVIARLLERLNQMEVATAYPFFLVLLDHQTAGRLTLVKVGQVLIVVENYMVRRYLAGESQSSLKRVFPTLGKEVAHDGDFVQSIMELLSKRNYPSNSKLARAAVNRQLYDRSEPNRQRTLLVLDSINRKLSEGSGGFTVLDGAATIEHIMPQTLSAEWLSALGIMAESIQREYLHTLGNLTLVTGGWNAELSNGPFSVKRPKLASNALRMNNSYFAEEIPRWGREEIIERTEALLEAAISIWPDYSGNSAGSGPAVVTSAGTATEFHFEILERIANRLNVAFRKISQARFESVDGKNRLVGLCSKSYESKGEILRFWYGVRPSQRAFLEWPGKSWIAFECSPDAGAVLIPFDDFTPHLASLHATEGQHWHVYLLQNGGKLEMPLPATGETVQLEKFRL